MKEMSLVSARAEKTRTQIRIAARQLFLQHGFQGTSTDAILAAAGIASKETLYRYYAKKEDVFVDVIRSLTVERTPLHVLMEQPASPKDVKELRALLQVVIQTVLETMLQPDYLALIRMIIAELPHFPQLGTLFLQTVPEQAMNYLLKLLRNGQAQGVVRQDKDLAMIGRMVIGTLLTYAVFDGLLHIQQEPQMPEESSIEAIVENIMESVVSTSTP